MKVALLAFLFLLRLFPLLLYMLDRYKSSDAPVVLFSPYLVQLTWAFTLHLLNCVTLEFYIGYLNVPRPNSDNYIILPNSTSILLRFKPQKIHIIILRSLTSI
jgi:hypothetical protein